jgi:hypothetical protein
MVGPRTARSRAALDDSATEAVTAKNRGIQRWERQRELRGSSMGTGETRRCLVVSQARRGRLATAE